MVSISPNNVSTAGPGRISMPRASSCFLLSFVDYSLFIMETVEMLLGEMETTSAALRRSFPPPICKIGRASCRERVYVLV